MDSEWRYQVMKDTTKDTVWYNVHRALDTPEGLCILPDPVLFAETLEELKIKVKMIEQDIYKYGVREYDA